MAQSAQALDSSADFAFVTDVSFSAPLLLGTVDVAVARTRMIASIQRGLETLTASASCVTITTDDATFVEARFDQCGSGDVPVDGVIRANLDFETTTDCLAGECPIAVTYSLDPVDFTAAGAGFEGKYSLRAPVDALGEPMSVAGEWTLTGADGASLGLVTGASWERTGLCVDMSWDATLTLNDEAQAAIGTDVATMSASARNVTRCLGECPRQGVLDIAYGQGEVLRIEYDGSATARVTGPRGFSADIELPCGRRP